MKTQTAQIATWLATIDKLQAECREIARLNAIGRAIDMQSRKVISLRLNALRIDVDG